MTHGCSRRAQFPLVYANDAFTDLTGYPAGDVLGRNYRFLQDTGTDPRGIDARSRALHTGQDVSVVLRNYRSDGSPFLNEASISPIRKPPTRSPTTSAPRSTSTTEASRPPLPGGTAGPVTR